MNVSKLSTATRFFVLALAAPVLTHAHPGHDGHELTWDFQSGFTHPLSGWDHLLAMIAVGIWAAQLGGRARLLVPTCFVAIMSLAALAAPAGVLIPEVEAGLAISVLVLGLLVAGSARLPLYASAAIVALFAAFHGYAHGAESGIAIHQGAFGLGFVTSTVFLHLLGYGFGALSIKFSSNAARVAGWGIATAGLALVIS